MPIWNSYNYERLYIPPYRLKYVPFGEDDVTQRTPHHGTRRRDVTYRTPHRDTRRRDVTTCTPHRGTRRATCYGVTTPKVLAFYAHTRWAVLKIYYYKVDWSWYLYSTSTARRHDSHKFCLVFPAREQVLCGRIVFLLHRIESGIAGRFITGFKTGELIDYWYTIYWVTTCHRYIFVCPVDYHQLQQYFCFK